MTLLSKGFILIKAMVLSLYIFTSNKPYFVYLNNPETLTKPGILHKQEFTSNQNIRFFYHFKNGTKENKTFSVKTSKDVKNLKQGSAKYHSPEKAGTVAAKNFMTNLPLTQRISLSTNLEPNQTISGIFEGEFQKNDTIVYKFGDSDNILESYSFIQNKYIHDYSYSIDYNTPAKYRLGDGVPNTIDGQYGNDIILKITPKNSGILKLSFSPRGGHGLILCENNGKIYLSNMQPARQKVVAFVMYVEKNKQESFKFMPLGGINYPIELEFSLHTFLSNEIT